MQETDIFVKIKKNSNDIILRLEGSIIAWCSIVIISKLCKLYFILRIYTKS